MATRKKPKSRKQSRHTPGWVWMLFGLSLGLVVAAAIYVGDRPAPVSAAATSEQAPDPAPVEPVVDTPPDPAPVAEEPHPSARFDFYDMLPQFEVVIPEVETDAIRDTRATAVEEPGSYVLQAGSFRELADADRMQANLALLGIESRVQRVAIDDDIYHRVRIGPTEDLEDLNQVRRRLWDAEIEVLLIRVPN
jgi:cell division protein FtsN